MCTLRGAFDMCIGMVDDGHPGYNHSVPSYVPNVCLCILKLLHMKREFVCVCVCMFWQLHDISTKPGESYELLFLFRSYFSRICCVLGALLSHLCRSLNLTLALIHSTTISASYRNAFHKIAHQTVYIYNPYRCVCMLCTIQTQLFCVTVYGLLFFFFCCFFCFCF